MAQPHLPLRRLRVVIPRGPLGGPRQGDTTCSAPKVSQIYGGGLYRARVHAALDLQLGRCTFRCRTASVQTGNIQYSFQRAHHEDKRENILLGVSQNFERYIASRIKENLRIICV